MLTSDWLEKTSTDNIEASNCKKICQGKFIIIFEKVSNRKKKVHIIEFPGKKTDQETWSDKFLSCDEHKGYKKLFVNSGSTSLHKKSLSYMQK